MRIRAYATTDPGHERPENEDCFIVDEGLGLFVVCDGMGGRSGGALAARTAAARLHAFLRESLKTVPAEPSPGVRARLAELMRQGVCEASAAVYALANSDDGKPGMGTTLTALLVRGHTGVMGHVGDSRLYLLREGQLHQLSDDHTVGAELLRRGVFSREDHKQSGYGHALTRAVGIQPSVHVDTLVFDILPEDTLLLCSDGLTREIPDAEELATFLGDGDAATISSGLVDLARHRGGHDNITAVVVRSAPEPTLAEDDRERLSEVRLRLDTLRYVWLFQHLTLKELVQVMDSFRPEDCAAGEAVLREGEAGSSLFVVLEGRLRVQRGQLELGKLETGSHFGEMSLLNGRPRSATVVAETPARLLRMERKEFVALIRQDARLAAKLLWTLSQVLSLRLDETSEHVLACGVGHVEEVPSPLWK